MDNIKALKAEVLRWKAIAEWTKIDANAWQKDAEDFKAKCIICHKVVADKNQEITELKKEREILQSTIRSLKSRG